ncbi:hypothetical protein Godav_000061 [Gossypium davidsonii]|uniref:Uncharacterized protein n=1 Tax=Gossypium davidsonii TaxID=34287 RepID=A0A7J8TDD5_GOSDV|nr:hypothetical protein [Gossypium davidsonii]
MAVTFFTDVEMNECLENNGGGWQDKTANLTACREEFVNVSWLMACNSKEMDTVTVKVRIKIYLHGLIVDTC